MPAPAVFKQLGLFVLPNFLSVESAAEFCQQMSAAPSKQALIVGPDGQGRLDPNSRKVDASLLPQQIRSPLKSQLCELIPDLQKHFGVELAGCEGPEYLIY